MSYSTDVFIKWVSEFESWAALREWLQSKMGGSLRIVEPKNSAYALVRYVKGQSDLSMEHVRWCRSVVVHKASRIPISIAPPKATEITNDIDPSVWSSAEEFADGTMLNVGMFQNQFASQGDPDEGTILSTRSRLGAGGRFFETGPTFAEMFHEALTNHKVADANAILPDQPSARAVFTSVVLQHPGNRIVKSIGAADFQIVHQGWVSSSGRVEIVEASSQFRCASEDTTLFFQVQSYPLEQIRSAKSVATWVAKKAQELGYGWQGVVLKDGRGGRWRVRSSVYEAVHRIRGNEASVEERFARLRRDRSLEQYYAFYPEDRESFYELEGRLRANTRRLAHYYTDVFRARSSPYHELPWPYKHHVSALHNLFKDSLRAQGKKVDLEQVVQYVNGLGLEDLSNMTKVHTLTPGKSKDVVVSTAQA